MRVLVLGAGAVGGYFGGRLLEAGRDVAFLVRPGRAAQLEEHGLVIRSPRGDARLTPPLLREGDLRAPFDLVIVGVKAYALDQALASVGAAVGRDTAVLPLLNGMRHLDVLDRCFGAERVLGGFCALAATLDPTGAVLHLNDGHVLRFGERAGGRSPRVAALAELVAPINADARPSDAILAGMWRKWVLLASLAGMTCLMRGGVGAVVAAPGGRELMERLLDECAAVAAAHGHPLRPDDSASIRATLTEPGSTFAASMLRDLGSGAPVEADHVLGDLLARAEANGIAAPLLQTAYCHLKVYEAGRVVRSGAA